MQKVKLSDQETVAMAGKLYTKIMTRFTIQALNTLATHTREGRSMNRKGLMSETEYIRDAHPKKAVYKGHPKNIFFTAAQAA